MGPPRQGLHRQRPRTRVRLGSDLRGKGHTGRGSRGRGGRGRGPGRPGAVRGRLRRRQEGRRLVGVAASRYAGSCAVAARYAHASHGSRRCSGRDPARPRPDHDRSGGDHHHAARASARSAPGARESRTDPDRAAAARTGIPPDHPAEPLPGARPSPSRRVESAERNGAARAPDRAARARRRRRARAVGRRRSAGLLPRSRGPRVSRRRRAHRSRQRSPGPVDADARHGGPPRSLSLFRDLQGRDRRS